MRQLVGSLAAGLLDLRGDGYGVLLYPDDYSLSRAFAWEWLERGRLYVEDGSLRFEAAKSRKR